MLFPLTFKFLKPLQNHMQKVISLCGCVTAGRDVLIAQPSSSRGIFLHYPNAQNHK